MTRSACKHIAITLVAATSFTSSYGQTVISSLDDTTARKSEVISYLDEEVFDDTEYAADGILSEWESVLEDYKSSDPEADEKSINAEINNSDEDYNTITVKGRTFRIPIAMNEEGTDLYRLTDDGIRIYMALDSPAYIQDIDNEIIRWIRLYAYHRRKNTKAMFDRYEKWKPYLDKLFTENGIPTEMAEICLIESACTYKAKSSAGAVGMWQLMPATARSCGLTVNERTDQRTDPIASTTAAIRVMKKYHDQTGDWALTAAAYNCGTGRIINKPKPWTWQNIKNTLPQETKQYVPCLIAIHYVWTYRKELGF